MIAELLDTITFFQLIDIVVDILQSILLIILVIHYRNLKNSLEEPIRFYTHIKDIFWTSNKKN